MKRWSVPLDLRSQFLEWYSALTAAKLSCALVTKTHEKMEMKKHAFHKYLTGKSPKLQSKVSTAENEWQKERRSETVQEQTNRKDEDTPHSKNTFISRIHRNKKLLKSAMHHFLISGVKSTCTKSPAFHAYPYCPAVCINTILYMESLFPWLT